jgi:hypothetical protein
VIRILLIGFHLVPLERAAGAALLALALIARSSSRFRPHSSQSTAPQRTPAYHGVRTHEGKYDRKEKVIGNILISGDLKKGMPMNTHLTWLLTAVMTFATISAKERLKN